jgi:transketolase
MEDRQIPTNISNESREIRKIVLETALNAKKGHVPSAFSWVEIAVVLYFKGIMKFDAKNPQMEDRDRFILSKGHGCLTLYAVLSKLGFFPSELLDDFGGKGAVLPGHPDTEIPGVETCTGSLGHGLGVGAGFAISAKLKKMKWYTYVVLGDAECHEGSIWEAAMFAGHQKLNSLVAIVDKNKLGATDFTENYASVKNLGERFSAFGWDVVECDGHDEDKLFELLSAHKSKKLDKPFCIIADTIKGKGVSFMENSKEWHTKLPKDDEIAKAFDCINNNND